MKQLKVKCEACGSTIRRIKPDVEVDVLKIAIDRLSDETYYDINVVCQRCFEILRNEV